MQQLPITIRTGPRELWADSRNNCAAYGRGMCDLHEQLRRCQQRLGTPAEQADDFDRARVLAHEINNQIQMAYLHAVVGTNTRPMAMAGMADEHRRVA